MLYMTLRNQYRLEELVAAYDALARVHIAVMDQAYEELIGISASRREFRLEALGYERPPEALPGLDAETDAWLRHLHDGSRHLAYDLLHLIQQVRRAMIFPGPDLQGPSRCIERLDITFTADADCQRLLEGTKARLREALLAPEQDIAEAQEFFLRSERAHTRFRKAHPERTPAQRCYRCTGYVRSLCEEGRRLDEAERLREAGSPIKRRAGYAASISLAALARLRAPPARLPGLAFQLSALKRASR
jgi:hypothetical protein